MCSNTPKEFEKTSDVLPFTKHGLSSVEEFRQAEEEIRELEWLRKAGLTSDEIKLYQKNEAKTLDSQLKVETTTLEEKLSYIYDKIKKLHDHSCVDLQQQPSTSNTDKEPTSSYPNGHPIKDIKNLENCLFGHLRDDIEPLSKRRKILRRLERKKERLLSDIPSLPNSTTNGAAPRPGSLWDVKEFQVKPQIPRKPTEQVVGPKQRTFYTIKNSKIVRLEPMDSAETSEDEYQAVDIVVPVNNAEAQLLEGTKMSIDDIKKIDRFKDYEPGVPSKILYLKNIAPTVSQAQLSLLFNQFVLDNGGPIDVRLMTGRMRGQAFVRFQNENLAIQALQEINGTIVSGRPIIAQFGRNTNRVQRVER